MKLYKESNIITDQSIDNTNISVPIDYIDDFVIGEKIKFSDSDTEHTIISVEKDINQLHTIINYSPATETTIISNTNILKLYEIYPENLNDYVNSMIIQESFNNIEGTQITLSNNAYRIKSIINVTQNIVLTVQEFVENDNIINVNSDINNGDLILILYIKAGI